MKFKLAICLAALAAVCVAPFGIAHAQKKNKNQPAQMSSNLQQQATTSTPPLQPGETLLWKGEALPRPGEMLP